MHSYAESGRPTDGDAARRLLEETRAKLFAGTATSSDHRPALHAMLLLPDRECADWLEEFRIEFGFVHARERAARDAQAESSEFDRFMRTFTGQRR